jgi:hypothetical protein
VMLEGALLSSICATYALPHLCLYPQLLVHCVFCILLPPPLGASGAPKSSQYKGSGRLSGTTNGGQQLPRAAVVGVGTSDSRHSCRALTV